MLDLIKELGFIEQYQYEINEMFSSIPYNVYFNLTDKEMTKSKSQLSKMRRKIKEGKDVSSYKQKFINDYYEQDSIILRNKLMKVETFTITDCFQKINILDYDRHDICNVPFMMKIDLSKFKDENHIMHILVLTQTAFIPLYGNAKQDYRISIEDMILNLITYEYTIYGTLPYDPNGGTDSGYGAALIEGYNSDVRLDMSFRLLYLPYSNTTPIPKWLDVLSESIMFYQKELYVDALFKAFSALDYIIELTYKYIETLAKEMNLYASMTSDEFAKFNDRFTGSNRRIIKEKLNSVLKLLGMDDTKRSEMIRSFIYYERIRNRIAHGDSIDDVINEDKMNFNLRERVNIFYHLMSELMYFLAHNDSFIDHVKMTINFLECEEPYSIEI